MTLLVEKGTFAKETSNVDGTDQTVNLANSSLTPKVLWLWTTSQTSNGSFGDGYCAAYGFSDGTNDACMSLVCADNTANADTGGVIRNDAVISYSILSGTVPTETARADVVSFNAGNFVLNWAVSDATASIIHYMVMGGTDITNVKVGNHSMATGAGTGAEAFTGVGFQGDFVNFIAVGSESSITLNTYGTANRNFFIGAAKSSSARWVFGGASEEGAGTADTYNYKEITRCLAMMNPTDGSTRLLSDFTSFDTDGFTLNNITENISLGPGLFASCVIKGGLWDVGNGTAPASIGQQTINTTSGRDAEGIMMFTWGDTTTSSAATGEPENRIAIGGADNSLNEGCTSVHDRDTPTVMENSSISKVDKIIAAHTANATASSSTILAEADIVDMDNDGNFVIDWTTTLSGMGYVWFAVSQTFVAGGGTNYTRSPTAENITVSDVSTTRVLSALRVPSTETVTVADSSLTRATQAFRTVSAESVTVAENSLTRSKTWPRVPSTDSTTVTDSSLTRMLSAVRVPSTETPAVSENLTRSKSANRTPSSDSTTVSDASVTRSISLTKVPSTETVTPSDISTTRIMTRVRAPNAETVTPTDSSLTRMLQLFRSPTTDSVTTSENITGGRVFDRDVSVDSVTITEVSLNRMLSLIRVPSAETPAISENLTRSKTWLRVPSADSVTAQDSSTTKSITRIRTPNTETVTVSDASLTRLLQAVRSPSSDSVVIVDTGLTRMLQAFRTPSSDSITVSENLSGGKVIARTPVAETVTVTDSSLNRVLSLLRIPTANTVTVLDSSLTRLLSAIRVPSTEVVGTSESVTGEKLVGAQSYHRIPTAETVNIVDSSLTRIKSALRLPSVEVISITDSSLIRRLSLSRSPASDSISISENLNVTASGRVSRSTSDTVNVSENLSRILSARRVPTAEIVNLNEQLTRILSASRTPSTDSIAVSEGTPIRVISRIRNLSETPEIVEASLARTLSAFRSLSDTTIVSELQSQVSLARRLEETVIVTEPIIERIVTAIRATAADTVLVDESVFFQAFHKFVFDSVVVAEQIFRERQGLSGPVTYAIPSEVRPLLGNIGNQRTDAQIELAIDSAYDEINRRTNRQPPNDWKDTENDFGIIKKIARFKAALEMAIGIKDFEDREWMQKEIEEMFTIIEQHDPGGTSSNDIVGSSEDVTFALNPGGIIWSQRYPNLKKGAKGENDTTINPAT